MASKTGICNEALAELGNTTISSIDEDTTQARALKAIWDNKRDRLLNLYKWNFAMKRSTLARLADAPDFEFDYQYALPNDCLRPWQVYDSDSNWVIEGKKLLIDDDAVELKYIARVEDISQYSPSFCRCLALELAIGVCMKLGGSKSDRDDLKRELVLELKNAYLLNAIEGKPYEDKDEQPADEGNYSWQKEGR